MKNLLWASALIASSLALSGQARGDGLLPGRISIGANVYVARRPCGPQLGPWYLYWPLEAHFQPIAPMAYPYWPPTGPQALPGAFRVPILPPGAPIPKSAARPVCLQPVGYSGPPPAYWYGR